MLDKVQLTLYEIFGYFLPGALAACAIAVLYWAVVLPRMPLPVYKLHPDVTGWALIIGLSYLTGHLVQGLGGRYLGGVEEDALGSDGTMPRSIVESAQKRAASVVGAMPSELDAICLFRILDEFSLQKGLIGDRDVYVYREGFYKGCAIAFALVCFALLARAFRDGTALSFPAYTYDISRIQILVGAALAALGARICKQRFHRFGMYRVTRAVFAFFAVCDQTDANGSRGGESKRKRE